MLSFLESLLRKSMLMNMVPLHGIKCMINVIQIMVWLRMAYEGEDSMEKVSKDQAKVKGNRSLSCWRTMGVVKKEVLAFSHVTNQYKIIYIVRRIKSLLDQLMKVAWCIWIHSFVSNWSSHMLKMAMLEKKNKIDKLALSIGEDWKIWLGVEEG